MTEILTELDRSLFLLLNGKLAHPVLDPVMTFITTQENWYPVLLGLWIAMLIWGGRRGRIAAVALVVAVAATDQVTSSILKPLFRRVRPCNAFAPWQVRLLVDRSKAFSFPSAHAANSFAMATIVGWRFRKYAPYAFAVAVAVAYSRVYVGVHYPFDTVAGALVGMVLGRLSLTLVVSIADWWKRRHKPLGDVLS
jgi:undecaprenyl-diphosphatase